MKIIRPQTFAGLLIVAMIALAGFAAFTASGVGNAPPLDLPDNVSARVAANLLAVDLGPDLLATNGNG